MDRLIRNITSTITSKLPEDKSYFTPDDLRSYDIPEFVVQRVEMEIYRNLNESIVPPHSEWADMSAGDVEHAWEQFIETILEEVRLPAAYVSSVFETSVADVIEMILQPRTAIPQILFGPEKVLTAEELEKRKPFISVNPHLAQALVKFMNKKRRDSIDLETAKKVVARVDERITANYNSLNWAQLLQPLFLLAGPKVDTETFRIFFKDRNMDRISRRFDLLNSELNKTEFIETMSSPDLLNEEGYEDDQASLFEVKFDPEHDEKESSAADSSQYDEKKSGGIDKSEETANEKTERTPGIKEKEDSSGYSERNTGLDESLDDEETEDDTLLGSFQDRLRKKSGEESRPAEDPDEKLSSLYESSDEVDDEESDVEKEDEDRPLYSRFDAEDEEPSDDEPGILDQYTEPEQDESEPERFFFDDQPTTDETEDWKPVIDDSDDDTETEAKVGVDDSDKTEQQEAEEYLDEDSGSEDDTETEKPIWQSFLGDEDAVEEKDIPDYPSIGIIEEEEDVDTDFEENDEEPIIDLTVDEEPGERPLRLIGWLQDDEERFKEAIFSGSDAAYEDSLMDLENFDNWKKASQFIEKEIFARNLVDMYEEEAVDFTDRLQAYFDEFKS